MDIYSKLGQMVRYANPTFGNTHDKETCSKYLKVDGVYCISNIEVHNWHTNVWLDGFENVIFNSVMFENVEEDK